MGQPAFASYVPPVPAPDWRIVPSGDRCIILEIAPAFSLECNRRAASFAHHIEHRRAIGELSGITDVVPSMAAVGIHYQPDQIQCEPSEWPYQSLARQLSRILSSFDAAPSAATSDEIVIPVCYGGEYGPDLPEVAHACGLTPDEVIQLHTSEAVNVLMLGFAPGHAYIGQFDERLGIARRSTPRTHVQSGSIGLANRQTVIYPCDLPGGWNLIGRTPWSIFDLESTSPCLLNPGDRVRFAAITANEFNAYARSPA